MLLIYRGAHPEVVVDEFNQDTVITRGEPTEIPDDLAARLLNQDTWSQADAAPVQTAPEVAQEPTSAPVAPAADTSTPEHN